MNDTFDDIRPYYPHEIPAAMQRIAASAEFAALAAYVFPGRDVDDVRRRVAALTTTEAFQAEVMAPFNDEVVRRSITRFTCGGLGYVGPGDACLYVSNHRDIVLDSSLLQNVFHRHGLPTSEITFGANLMSTPLIVDIGKANKMFRVERGATPKAFYRLSAHVSAYIREAITRRHASVWIAQRNGRTKDGDDRTDQGIVRMFAMSAPGDPVAALADLHIVPVSVSYEWEPCDSLKAIERYVSRSGRYVKRPGEDVESILTGIIQPKGRVHIEICRPIAADELAALAEGPRGGYYQRVAQLIDERIVGHYRLWPNNYVAHDLMTGRDAHRDLYTEAERAAFVDSLARLDDAARLSPHAPIDPDALRAIYVAIYATPVSRRLSLSAHAPAARPL